MLASRKHFRDFVNSHKLLGLLLVLLLVLLLMIIIVVILVLRCSLAASASPALGGRAESLTCCAPSAAMAFKKLVFLLTG